SFGTKVLYRSNGYRITTVGSIVRRKLPLITYTCIEIVQEIKRISVPKSEHGVITGGKINRIKHRIWVLTYIIRTWPRAYFTHPGNFKLQPIKAKHTGITHMSDFFVATIPEFRIGKIPGSMIAEFILG